MSDFSKTFILILWPLAFLNRSDYISEAFEISRFSIIEFPRMLRFSDSAGSKHDSLSFAVPSIAFPIKSQGRHPG